MEIANLRIAVVILTWNRASELAESLKSVSMQTRLPDEIIVVDSASSDDTCSMVRQRFPEVNLVRLHRNLGCPEGRNIAMANCIADVIYSLDDDARMHRRCLEMVEKAFIEHNRAGIVASKIFLDLDPSPEQTKAQMAKMPRQTIRFSGGACGLRREVLEKAGYYPHDFWRQSEEADLALRAINAGFEVWYAPAAIVFHPPGIGSDRSVTRLSAENSLSSVIRLAPARYLPTVLTHQIAKFVAYGLHNGNSLGVAKALLSSLLAFPSLWKERAPVRVASMREYLRLRKEITRS